MNDLLLWNGLEEVVPSCCIEESSKQVLLTLYSRLIRTAGRLHPQDILPWRCLGKRIAPGKSAVEQSSQSGRAGPLLPEECFIDNPAGLLKWTHFFVAMAQLHQYLCHCHIGSAACRPGVWHSLEFLDQFIGGFTVEIRIRFQPGKFRGRYVEIRVRVRSRAV